MKSRALDVGHELWYPSFEIIGMVRALLAGRLCLGVPTLSNHSLSLSVRLVESTNIARVAYIPYRHLRLYSFPLPVPRSPRLLADLPELNDEILISSELCNVTKLSVPLSFVSVRLYCTYHIFSSTTFCKECFRLPKTDVLLLLSV